MPGDRTQFGVNCFSPATQLFIATGAIGIPFAHGTSFRGCLSHDVAVQFCAKKKKKRGNKRHHATNKCVFRGFA